MLVVCKNNIFYYSSEVAFCIRSRSIVGKAVLALYTNTRASVMRFTSSSVCLTIPTVELDPGDLETRPGGLEGDRSYRSIFNACHS